MQHDTHDFISFGHISFFKDILTFLVTFSDLIESDGWRSTWESREPDIFSFLI